MSATTLPPVAVDKELAKQLKRRAAQAIQARMELEELIIKAVAAGGSYREVAKLVGMTHPTVMKIVMSAPTLKLPPDGKIPSVEGDE